MKSHTPEPRWLAMLAALVFTGGALLILMGTDVLLHPSTWTDSHYLTILTVAGTVAAGHLAWDAIATRKALSALGFAVLFAAGTALVVFNSVGRQAEVTDTKTLDAEHVNEAISEKKAELQKAKDALVHANEMVEVQINGGIHPETGKRVQPGCGDVCRGWKAQRQEMYSLVTSLEADLASIGPRKPVNAKAAKFAEITALFGTDKAKATAMFTLLEPFFWTLFFEFGSVVSLGFAFRRKPRTIRESRKVQPDHQSDYPEIPVSSANVVRGYFGPNPDPDGPTPGRRFSREEAKADLLARIHAGETIPSQDTLASDWDRPKQTVSDWLRHWADECEEVSRVRAGRCKAVTAA